MLRCKDAAHLASKSLDASLTTRERLGLRFHLLMCRACSRYTKQIRRLHEMLSKGIESLEEMDVLADFRLSDEDRERMIRAISADASKPV